MVVDRWISNVHVLSGRRWYALGVRFAGTGCVGGGVAQWSWDLGIRHYHICFG